jgi:ATP-binding cassette subfamily B protein
MKLAHHSLCSHGGQPTLIAYDYDLKKAVSDNQIAGLWHLMTGHRMKYVGSALSLGISALSKTATFLLLRYLIDDVLSQANPDLSPLVPIALAFVALAVAEGAFAYISGRLSAQVAEKVTVRLRNYLFDHVQRLPFRYFDKTATGDLIQRSTSDVDAIRRFYADQGIGLARIALLFVINLGILFLLNPTLTLISTIAIPIIIVMSLYFFRRVSKVYEGFQEQDSVLSTRLQENLSGVRVVKAFARQDYEIKRFDDVNLERYKRGRDLLINFSVYWPLTDVICGVQYVSVLLIGAIMVLDGALTLGTFLAFVGLIWQVLNPLRNLGRIITQISEGAVSYKRVIDIIREDREPISEGTHQPAEGLRGEIVFEGVTFGYDPEKPVLHDISFTAEPGQMIALLGSTGAGKTSLLGLLPRFYPYTAGSIRVDGVELTEYPRDFLRRQIGIVEQEPFLFSRTIKENIAYGANRTVSDEDIVAAAKAAAIHDVILSFKDGYQTMVGEKGVTLSGGQKQRVAIARALLKDPRVLILDDATSSVDTETEAQIREALLRLMQGRTSFVIAHRVTTVMHADLILVMDKGRIVQRGTHQELIEQPGIYRQIYEVQTQIEEELEKELQLV